MANLKRFTLAQSEHPTTGFPKQHLVKRGSGDTLCGIMITPYWDLKKEKTENWIEKNHTAICSRCLRSMRKKCHD